MEINLRKANAIQAEIRRAFNAVETKNTVSVTEFTQEVAGEINGASVLYQLGLQRKEQLNTALYNIRKSVAEANATAGINVLLTEVQRIEAIMSVYSNVATQTVAKPLEELNARLEKMRSAPNEARMSLYGDRYNSVEASVVTSEVVANAKEKVKELRRQRQNLQDKLLTLNVNTLITVNPEDLTVLKEEGIL
jgi:hypothetical protein